MNQRQIRRGNRNCFRVADEIRPELHRYCARLMGSVIEGRTWCRTRSSAPCRAGGARRSPVVAALAVPNCSQPRARSLRAERCVSRTDRSGLGLADCGSRSIEALMEKEAVSTAVSRFAELPVLQRSVVILKDVLGEPLSEIASLLGLTSTGERASRPRPGEASRSQCSRRAVDKAEDRLRPRSARYVALFNQRDWNGLRSLLADDVRLVQSSHPPRVGRADVGMFFTIYSKRDRVSGWRQPGLRAVRHRRIRRSRRPEAQLRDVARMAGRTHQLHSRLSLCPIRSRGRRTDIVADRNQGRSAQTVRIASRGETRL